MLTNSEHVKPISPCDIPYAKAKAFPPLVIQIFNDEIARKFTHGRAHVLQDNIVAKLVAAGYSRQQIFDEGLLNVEEIYSDAGWDVTYDKPGYNESYAASFTFKIPR